MRLKPINRRLTMLHKQLSARLSEAFRERLFNGKRLVEYRGDPQGYAQHVLKLDPGLTPDQINIVNLVESRHRVHCRAGHDVGKSFVAAFLVNYLYDTYEEVVIITTAPRLESVKDIVWREIRQQRRNAGLLADFTGPRSLRLQSSPYHLAFGTTASSHTAFAGKHGKQVFIIVDEAVGLKPEFWEAIDSMLQGEKTALFAIYNPTTTACQCYHEEKQKGVVVYQMSCLNHPNIAAELDLQSPPYPASVRLAWVLEHIEKYCDPLHPEDAPDAAKGDFQFPPPTAAKFLSRHRIPARWWRPSVRADGRILGRWPSSTVDTFWSRYLVELCRNRRQEIKPQWPVAIGCDVARFGDDFTAIVIRQGPCVVHVEEHNGWDGKKIADRLKQLCHQYPGPQSPRKIRVFVDETGGWGSGVLDNAGVADLKYNFIGVNAAAAAPKAEKELYKNVRTRLWATTAELAKQGLVDFTRLPKLVFEELERQLLSQTYELGLGDMIIATPKDDIKEKVLKRSPDTADALNLAYYAGHDTRQDSPSTITV
jgi:hypothetical protein